ncbi:hypothetical protein N7931_15050 [Catenovulum sp. 2E275]|uniref:hypothetical protein n=1 Tax=Catenovulum sp. 2E275 TaxID=2980497 RepID=UPI0021D218B1|nr:hypothetical protein [Catenovulum sp. 2E275]MCU4676950.1 hypothetical protein [Catenovulum sp. 2E275]
MNEISSSQYQLYTNTALTSSQTTQSNQFTPPPPPPNDANISAIGQFASQLSEEETSELQSFFDSVQQAKEDGTFDAEALAEDAPQALQDLASELDLDLTSLLENTQSQSDMPPPPQGQMGQMPPPPPANENESDEESTTDSELSDMMDFKALFEDSVASGEYDLAALAEQAPDGLNQMASDMGLSTEELLTDMANRLESGEEAMLPPPPKGREMMQAYGEQSKSNSGINDLNSLYAALRIPQNNSSETE